jgi:hypothetical protein
MSYEIVSSVVFALILFRLIEDGVEYVAEKLLQRKRDKEFKDLMAKLEANFSSGRLTNYDDKTCGDEYCDICNDDEGTISIPVVKRKPAKAQPVRRPVKKAVAKKKTVKKAAPKRK